MGCMGTAVTYDRQTCVVVETGIATELGKIADLIQDVKLESMPLQQRLDQVGKLPALLGMITVALALTAASVGTWPIP